VCPRAKVTINSLYEVVYEKSIGTKMNYLDLCLEVISRSCQPLRYIWHWISRKPLQIESWLQRTANRKWPTRNQMTNEWIIKDESCIVLAKTSWQPSKFPDNYSSLWKPLTNDVMWLRKVKLVTSIRLERNIPKTAGDAI